MKSPFELMIRTPDGQIAEYSDEEGQTYGFASKRAAETFARKEAKEIGRSARVGELPKGEYQFAAVPVADPVEARYDFPSRYEVMSFQAPSRKPKRARLGAPTAG